MKQQKKVLATLVKLLVISVISSTSSYARETPTVTQAARAGVAVGAGDAMNPTTAANAPSSASSAIDDLPAPTPIKDPYERFNRNMFTFNDKIDTYFLKPIARVYNKIMPKPLNAGIHNFFNNLGEIPTIANDILQLKPYQMLNDMWRLGINTTIGIGGLFDVAQRMNLRYYANDFGLTLATWGWRNSNYLVVPFFGPNTIRDVFEIPTDYYAFSIYPYIRSPYASYGLYSLSVVDRRAHLLQFESVFEESTLDKYVFMRNAYMQHRAYQIQQNARRGYKDQVLANCEKNNENCAISS